MSKIVYTAVRYTHARTAEVVWPDSMLVHMFGKSLINLPDRVNTHTHTHTHKQEVTVYKPPSVERVYMEREA